MSNAASGALGRGRDRATDLGFAAAWAAVRTLPEPLAKRAFQAAADRAVTKGGRGVTQLWRNLRRVVGPAVSQDELAEIVQAGMRSYARYWLETFRLPAMDKRDVAAKTDRNTIGAEHIDAAMAAGNGMILALPHMGNWDVAGVWLLDRGIPFATVAERLKPESLFDRFVAYRESLGMEVLALTGAEHPPTAVLTERLRAGGCVCLVAERDLSAKGVEVDFFGEPTRMPAGPALLAATTGAALLPVGLWFEGDEWGQRIGAPIELAGKRLGDKVRGGTQSLANVFAELIAEHPSDWHMLQRLWLADLETDRQTEPNGN